MNIFFVGMGNMGQQRFNAVKKLKIKYKLNVVGYLDPYVDSIEYENKKLYSIDGLSEEFIIRNKVDFFIIGTPHNLFTVSSELSC